MSGLSTELRISLGAGAVITVIYILIAVNGVPGSSSALGYGLGIVGFLLMLGAEVLYTWRKMKKEAKWGKLRVWLQAHIILGIIGPYLVLLHSAWRLNGVAGVLMLLTMMMVASGFLCSYIYPALPRNVEGAELTLQEIETQIAETNASLQEWETQHPEAVVLLGQRLEELEKNVPGSDVGSVLGRSFLRFNYLRQLRAELQRLKNAGVEQAGELGQLLDRRYRLEAQVNSLATARKLLGQARAIHIVIGVVLFAVAIVHILVAFYYATLAG